MGLSSVSYSQLERKSSFQSVTSVRSTGLTYKSPQCIVCGERPKTTPPVPNLELALFLRTLKAEKMTEHENPAYRENVEDDGLSDDDYNCKRIRECRIGVMGSSGVGKTSLTRVQYGNDILFSDLLGKRTEASLSNTFMIDIVDSNNSEHSIRTSQGFVIMYSITDRESFYEAADIFTAIEKARGGKVPIVLVGSKSDLHRKRRVTAFEGQTLARHMGCPFIEISSRNNDCVNEAALSGYSKHFQTRVQYGNDILFSDLLGKRTEASLSNTFMIDIVDSNNSEHSIRTSQGFVIMYSITDRESFYEAADIFTAIERARGGKVPIVLVGSKSDLHRKRRVTAFEGQTLARHMGCPFIEISSRNNDCVNEAFLELMRIVERRRMMFCT
ncbi:Ras family protein [Cooperia oncophora]